MRSARRGSIASLLLAAGLVVPAIPAVADLLLVPRGSIWRYDDTGTDLGTAWRDTTFDDSGWNSGPAPLGYGEGSVVTPISFGGDASNKHPTAYFRTTFELTEDPDTLAGLLLRLDYDDGIVVYLNGTEIARRSLPGGTITFNTFASSHESGSFETIDVDAFLDRLVPGTNWLAVEVHQVSPSSSDLVMDAELLVPTGAPFLLRGPYLQVGTESRITVRWRTDRSSESVVRYGSAPGALTSTALGAESDEHEVTITGLAPETRYYYAVGTTADTLAGADSSHWFWTRPPPGSSRATRVWILGDSGLPGPNQRAVRDVYRDFTGDRYTDVWLMLGDNAYNTGTDLEYQNAVFDVYQDFLRTTTLWPTRGNHDFIHGGENNDYYDNFTMPTDSVAGGLASGTEAYYSFVHGNVRFLCLDSQGSSREPGSAMLTWLENDLLAATEDWIVAYWHHPPYSKGSHDSDAESRLIDMRENVLPILEDGGVDLVLAGHSHSYERSFLLDEHYGFSSTLHDSMKVDAGDGYPSGDGAYLKPTLGGPTPHEGTVYAVCGSSSQLAVRALDHPVMVANFNLMGSMVIDVDGDRLEGRFIDRDSLVQDHFAILKGGAVAVDGAPPPRPGHPTAAPNPFTRNTRLAFTLPVAGHATLEIYDPAGRRVARLHDGPLPAGPHAIDWNAKSSAGSAVAPGVYFVRLALDGSQVTRKLLLIR